VHYALLGQVAIIGNEQVAKSSILDGGWHLSNFAPLDVFDEPSVR
jgi:hypothetical protein